MEELEKVIEELKNKASELAYHKGVTDLFILIEDIFSDNKLEGSQAYNDFWKIKEKFINKGELW